MYTIYSLNNCIFCDRAKDFLHSKNIDFIEIRYVKGPDTDKIMELVELTGCSAFPQIFYNNAFIGGYTQLLTREDDEVRFDEIF